MNFNRLYIRMINRIVCKNAEKIKKNGGKDMSNLSNTQFFQVEPGPQISARDILEIVFKALKEKGYNPVNQIVGYYVRRSDIYYKL